MRSFGSETTNESLMDRKASLLPVFDQAFSPSNPGAYRILSNFPGQSGLENRCSNRQFSICRTTREKRCNDERYKRLAPS